MPAPDIIHARTPVDSTWWMQAAQGAVRRFCGWHVAPIVTETLRVDAYGGRILELPSKRVTAISSISVDGKDLAGQFDWSEAGTVKLRSGCWPDAPGSVRVVLTHGWESEDVPEVAALILTVARRAATSPGARTARAVNGASESFATAGGAPLSVPLLEIEKATLAPYRLNWGPQ